MVTLRSLNGECCCRTRWTAFLGNKMLRYIAIKCLTFHDYGARHCHRMLLALGGDTLVQFGEQRPSWRTRTATAWARWTFSIANVVSIQDTAQHPYCWQSQSHVRHLEGLAPTVVPWRTVCVVAALSNLVSLCTKTWKSFQSNLRKICKIGGVPIIFVLF